MLDKVQSATDDNDKRIDALLEGKEAAVGEV